MQTYDKRQEIHVHPVKGSFHFIMLTKPVHFWLFREPDTRNWKSLDTRVPVKIFEKHINTPKMYKITNMNTSFSCFIRVIINVDLL